MLQYYFDEQSAAVQREYRPKSKANKQEWVTAAHRAHSEALCAEVEATGERMDDGADGQGHTTEVEDSHAAVAAPTTVRSGRAVTRPQRFRDLDEC